MCDYVWRLSFFTFKNVLLLTSGTIFGNNAYVACKLLSWCESFEVADLCSRVGAVCISFYEKHSGLFILSVYRFSSAMFSVPSYMRESIAYSFYSKALKSLTHSITIT